MPLARSPKPRLRSPLFGRRGRGFHSLRRLPLLVESLEERALLAVAFTQLSSGGIVSRGSFDGAGSLIAFMSTANLTGANPEENREIFLYDVEYGSVAQVTHSATGDSDAPSLSADGNWIAFESTANLTGQNDDERESRELFLFDVASGAFTQITDTHFGSNEDASISGDGGRISFRSNDNLTGGNADNNSEIFWFEVASGEFTQITHTTEYSVFTFPVAVMSADGSRIAMRSNNNQTGGNADGNLEIFTYDIADGRLSQITNTPSGHSTNLSISADGKRIAFFADSEPTGINPDRNLEIYLFDEVAGAITPITDTWFALNFDPTISGDGGRIAFVSTADLLGGNPDWSQEIFTFDVASGEFAQVTDTGDGFKSQAVLSANGSLLAFKSNNDFAGGNAGRDGQLFLADSAPIPGNRAPTAIADETYLVEEGATLDAAAPGVLANDSDADGDPLTAVLVAGPSHGSLTLNADGSFTYVHDGGETSVDGFSYVANDGQAESDEARVTISISPSNDAPQANDDSHAVLMGETLSVDAPGVLSNDDDVEGDSLTAVLVSGPSHGLLTFNADGSFTYVHDGSTAGSDSFTYKPNDGVDDGNAATVAIVIDSRVNRTPTADNDVYSVFRGETLIIGTPGVLHGDSDPDGDALTAILVAGPAHGSLALSADGSFTYVHDGSTTTSDSFTYKPNDGVDDGNTATVTIQTRERQADLIIGATNSDDTPQAGQHGLTLTVIVTNLGPQAASDVTVDFELPGGLIVTASQGPGEFDVSSGSWFVGHLSPEPFFGSAVTLVLTLDVGLETGGQTLVTEIVASSSIFDPRPGNNVREVTIVPDPVLADLSVGMYIDNLTPNEGDTFLLWVTVINSGPNAASGISASVALPAGLVVTNIQIDQGAYDPQTGIWTLGDLDLISVSDYAADLYLTLNMSLGTGAQTLVIEAEVLSTNTFLDPSPNDNVASVTISPTGLQADVGVSFNGDGKNAREGETIFVPLAVFNNGPDPATNVRIAITPEPRLRVTGINGAFDGSYDPASGILSLPNLPVGFVLVDVIVAVSLDDFDDWIEVNERVLTATVESAYPALDPAPFNNSRDYRVFIHPLRADVGVSFNGDGKNAREGETISVPLAVFNNGPNPATNVRIAITPEPRLRVTGINGAFDGSYDPASGILTLPNLPVGSVVVDVIVAVGLDDFDDWVEVNERVLTATVESAYPALDPAPFNNFRDYRVSIHPLKADVGVSFNGDGKNAREGETISVPLAVFNNGPDPATNVRIAITPEPRLRVTGINGAFDGSYDPASGILSLPNLPVGFVLVDVTVAVSLDDFDDWVEVNERVLAATVESAYPALDPAPGNNSRDYRVFIHPINRPPAAAVGGPYSIIEGDAVTLDAFGSTDPDGNSLTYSWDVNGDGVFGDETGVMLTLSWLQLVALGHGDGPFATNHMRVRVDDGNGESAVSSPATLLLLNAPPAATEFAVNSGVDASGRGVRLFPVTFSVAATDPSPSDTFQYEFDWDGDGSWDERTTAGYGGSILMSHAYVMAGVFTPKVRVLDDDGGISNARALGAPLTILGAGVIDRRLVVGGTASADLVDISPASSGRIRLDVGGVISYVPQNSVDLIDLRLGAGDDDARVGSAVAIRTLIDGGPGNDRLRGGDYMDGGDGDDQISDGRGAATILGGFGADVIYAGRGGDTIDGGDGDDQIFGGVGADMILGGAGDDEIRGGAGADAIKGGAGDDTIDGGVGDDQVLAGDGHDDVDGGAGRDSINGGDGNDALRGGAGDDVLIGGAGDDALEGGGGRDLLIGGDGADVLEGGDDDDLLIGGYTLFDNNVAALDLILSEWRSSGNYSTRISNIRSGAGAFLSGAGVRLASSGPGRTAFDDSVRDTLRGQGGRDWFFADDDGVSFDNDLIESLANDERVDPLAD